MLECSFYVCLNSTAERARKGVRIGVLEEGAENREPSHTERICRGKRVIGRSDDWLWVRL